MKKKALTLFLALCFAGCQLTEDGAGDTETLTVNKNFRGIQADINLPPSEHVVLEEENWEQLWTYVDTNIPPQKAPEIDFNKHMAVAVFMGGKPTGGYSIEIESVKTVNDRIDVIYSTTSPEPDAMVTQALTSPYHIVILPRIDDKEVNFIRE